ncbi:hypothetical protein GGI00_004876 [Coemansia sp. RSA 2681]|nr:hypothetical protein GGI00_004876 [Coemansia sp. RSA 2681]
MTKLSIGASQSAGRREHPATAVGKAPVEDSKADVNMDTESDARPSDGSESSTASDSDSDSDSSDSTDTQEEGDLDGEPLEEESDDERGQTFGHERSSGDRAPFRYRTTKYMGPVVRQWPVHRTKYTYDYEPEHVHPQTAHRTMQGILADRDRNITRQILIRGDLPADTRVVKNSVRLCNLTSGNALRWPTIDIHRYIDHIQLYRHLPMGVDQMRSCRDPYTSINLEEPGEEWDQMQMDFLYGSSPAGGGGASLEKSGYACGFTATTDGSEISDTRRNGGMGIVVKRPEEYVSTTGLARTSDDAQLLTLLQLKHPVLTKARVRETHLYDVFEDRCPNILSSYYQSVVDMTRAQVINQVLKATAQSAGSCPPQLSKFTSCSVAEEAVSGVSRIWDKTSGFWRPQLDACFVGKGQRRQIACMPFPGSPRTGWISVLEAALAADIPPQVVARCFHRLTKLCDETRDNKGFGLSQKYFKSTIVASRRYAARDDADHE